LSVNFTGQQNYTAPHSLIATYSDCLVTKIPKPSPLMAMGLTTNGRSIKPGVSPMFKFGFYPLGAVGISKSTGYTIPWDGNYNGRPLPVGTYYNVISLKTERHHFGDLLPLSGSCFANKQKFIFI
jgi:hypothetical protein